MSSAAMASKQAAVRGAKKADNNSIGQLYTRLVRRAASRTDYKVRVILVGVMPVILSGSLTRSTGDGIHCRSPPLGPRQRPACNDSDNVAH